MERLSPDDRTRLARNLDALEERIENACSSAGRSRSDLRLVSVTKSVGSPVAQALRELGALDLGESRPSELLLKRGEVTTPGPWHFIGHLQRRAVKDAVCADLIHSVDRESLVGYLASQAACPPILLQVNVSSEIAKQGFSPEEAPQALALAVESGLSVRGLMTMAPRSGDESLVRGSFAGLRKIRDRLASEEFPLSELSMGMSGDFELAIAEGATLVRVGTALFEGLGSPPASISK